MIAVIADDLTGAAELGGIGLRHGLSVEINMEVNRATKAALLVIAADTRSMGEEAAIREMERLTRQLILLEPDWIYKKVDSVLRGHVVAEISAQLNASGLGRALLVPANPSLGRTILDETYFLNGAPVHRSHFSVDPEFPITDSDIRKMLRVSRELVVIKKIGQQLPAEGIIVGEVQDEAGLAAWAAYVDGGTLAAGAAGFFSAILAARRPMGARLSEPPAMGRPRVFVYGSTFGKSREMIRKIKEGGGPVSYMPRAIGITEDETASEIESWGAEVVALLRTHGKAIIAIGEEMSGEAGAAATKVGGTARFLRERMAALVQRVLQEQRVGELLIEGGATAYAILRRAGLPIFFPEQEIAPGVIRMRVEGGSGLYVTVKPGSYNWPDFIYND